MELIGQWEGETMGLGVGGKISLQVFQVPLRNPIPDLSEYTLLRRSQERPTEAHATHAPVYQEVSYIFTGSF